MGKREIEISGCERNSSNGIVGKINNACERLLGHDKAAATVGLLADFAVASAGINPIIGVVISRIIGYVEERNLKIFCKNWIKNGIESKILDREAEWEDLVIHAVKKSLAATQKGQIDKIVEILRWSLDQKVDKADISFDYINTISELSEMEARVLFYAYKKFEFEQKESVQSGDFDDDFNMDLNWVLLRLEAKGLLERIISEQYIVGGMSRFSKTEYGRGLFKSLESEPRLEIE